ncbi:MAG: mechanosensitive ion channel family protein [Actinomycetes bacterium]
MLAIAGVPTALPSLPLDGRNPCADQGGAVCGIVRHLTNDPDLAGTLRDVFTKTFDILLIILVAIVIRALLNRIIDRAVRRTKLAPSLHDLPSRLRRRRAGEGDAIAVTPERREQRAETIGSVLHSTVTAIVGTIAFIEVLGKIGINLAPIVASAGIVGIALGFGAQNLVKDFLSGIFMILEDQYGVGDVIDVGDATGTVEAVALRTTRLRDVKGTVWHVRNGEIVRIGNKSQGWSRALLDIPVAYGHSTDEARELIKEIADSVWQDPEWAPKILEEPEVWGVEDLGADGVALRLVVKTAPLAQWGVSRELRSRIKKAFDERGFEIPYKQHTIWLRNDEPKPNGRPAAKKTAARR